MHTFTGCLEERNSLLLVTVHVLYHKAREIHEELASEILY